MFEQDDDRGFWDDEPTRPLQRLTARMKPAGAPPPAPTRLWPSRANAPRAHESAPALFDHGNDPDLFDDIDTDIEIEPVLWPDERRSMSRDGARDGARGATATMTRPLQRPVTYDDDVLDTPADDQWPRSVGEAFLMLGGRIVRFVRERTATMSPFARRIGVLVLMLLLCIPIAMGLRGGSLTGSLDKGLQPDNTTVAIGDTAATAPAADAVVVPAMGAAATPATAGTQAPAAAPVCSASYTIVAGDYWISIADRAGVTTKALLAANNATTKTVLLPGKSVCLPAGAKVPSPTKAASTASAAPATATTVKAAAAAPVCAKKYTIVSGDAWSLIASRANITTSQLLAANNATTKTVLLPGKSICLPAGASMPTPTTTATTVKVTSTTQPSSGGGIVKTRAYSQTEVQAIIRQYWPAELQDWALKQAWKESNWQNNAYNWCCYGLYQINFNAHQSWLKNYGVTSASQLLDPVVNTKMAIIVYQRMGGYWPTGA